MSNAELYRRITGIDVVDDKTFVMHLDRVEFEYNAINDFRPLPAHLERPVFEADPVGVPQAHHLRHRPGQPGPVLRPYRITEVSSGAFIVLEPNPTWWGEPPQFQRIVVKVIENTAALEANLLSGSIDMIAGELGLTIDQALAFEKRHGDQFQIVYEPGLTYEHIDLNLDNPILADVRVRKALIMGLDREALSQQLFEGASRWRTPASTRSTGCTATRCRATTRISRPRQRCSTRPGGVRSRAACGTMPPASRSLSS